MDERERRRADAEAMAGAIEQRRARESTAAQKIVDDFVARAQRAGLPDAPLRARGHSGSATYRTGLRGWTIRRNGSLAIDTDGRFLILSAPAGFTARFTGVTLLPHDPPLVVGEGGRDGESIPLDVLLRQRLDAGPSWP